MTSIEEFASGEALFDGHYRLLRPLDTASGSTDVWLAIDVNTIEHYFSQFEDGGHVIDESTGLQVVIKFFSSEKELDVQEEQRLRNEFKTIQRCRHVNLLQPIEFSVFMGVPYLVIPYCEAGSVEHYLDEKMSKDMVWKFILDVASGLDSLHTSKMVHQNLKPSNILIDEKGNFVLTDYGFKNAGCISDENKRAFAYLAPEGISSNTKPSPESDIWAFGATLCVMLTGNPPFGEKGGRALVKTNVPMPELKEIPSNIKSLILSCLQSDPTKRPTARQIMEVAQKKHFSSKSKKSVLPVIIIVASILIVGGMLGFLTTREKPKEEIVVEEKTDYYEKAVELLSEITTARDGYHILDSLVAENDFQATFLMSRLYFEPANDRDRVFYNSTWKNMRFNAGISYDNQKAHGLLYRALLLNENDYVTLYELGCDYMAPNGQRGSEKNLNYAKWCFLQAETAVRASQDVDASKYLERIDELSSRIRNHEIQNDTVLQPMMPQQ